MLRQGILKNSAFHSVIGESSIIAPRGEKRQRSIVADLLLTALIDAFSILVIFLLMSFSSTGEVLFMGKDMELPKAAKGEVLDRVPVVRINDGKYYLEDTEVAADGLTAAIIELRKKFQETRPNEEFPSVLTIQADRRVRYEILSSIIQASSQAGISDIKFAIVMK